MVVPTILYQGEIGIIRQLSNLPMVKVFMSKFKWYPKRLYRFGEVFNEALKICISVFPIHDIETVHVENDDHDSSDCEYGKNLRSFWLALARIKPCSSLINITLLVCATDPFSKYDTSIVS